MHSVLNNANAATTPTNLQVLVEAYRMGRLIAVLPFLQKLLECCKVGIPLHVVNSSYVAGDVWMSRG